MGQFAAESSSTRSTPTTASPGSDAGRAEWLRANPSPPCTVRDVADHVEHVRDVAGVRHIGLGGDFDGVACTPEGLADVAGYPALLAELAGRGWSDTDLAALAWHNAVRVLRDTESSARSAQRERGPSTATIDELDRPVPARR